LKVTNQQKEKLKMTRKSEVITLQMSLKICKAKHVRVPKYVHKIVKHVVQFLFTEEDSA